jgi:hypothetical protein
LIHLVRRRQHALCYNTRVVESFFASACRGGDPPGLIHEHANNKKSPDYRHHRPGWRIPCATAAGKGLRSHRYLPPSSSVNFWRIEELGIQTHPNLNLVEYDLTDLSSSIRLMQSAQPDEVYNLAAQSFVGVSFEQPVTTASDHRPRRRQPAGSDPHRQSEDPLLPGVDLRNVRQGAGRAARSKTPRSTRAARTAWPSCTRTG